MDGNQDVHTNRDDHTCNDGNCSADADAYGNITATDSVAHEDTNLHGNGVTAAHIISYDDANTHGDIIAAYGVTYIDGNADRNGVTPADGNIDGHHRTVGNFSSDCSIAGRYEHASGNAGIAHPCASGDPYSAMVAFPINSNTNVLGYQTLMCGRWN